MARHSLDLEPHLTNSGYRMAWVIWERVGDDWEQEIGFHGLPTTPFVSWGACAAAIADRGSLKARRVA